MNQLATVDLQTGEIVAEQLPALSDVSHAKLPTTYKAARAALSECSRIDECQQWADKAEALASYARQAKDETLRRLADRIQARASRRCGELLKQIPASPGGQPTHDGGGISRTKAAAEAGLSERQKVTALRVASIPEKVFECAVESDNPPTVTQLAAMGTQARSVPAGPDLSALRKFARYCGSTDPITTASLIPSQQERGELRALVGEIDSWLDQFVTTL